MRRGSGRRVGPVACAVVATALAVTTAATGGPVPVAAGATTAAPAAVPDPVRILVVGDSISQGSAGDWTWRYRLWLHLTGNAVEVDFVGYRDDLRDDIAKTFGNQDYLQPEFDRAHAARWGMKLAEPDVPIADLVADYQPDVLVELLGDNDLSAGQSAEQVTGLLRGFVTSARSVDPTIDVVLTTDPRPTVQPEASDFNLLVSDLATELDSPASPVVVADAAAGYDENQDTYDGAHPNSHGELKIAAAVADALHELGVGPAATRPLPDVPRGPRIPPQLSATGTIHGAALSWVRSPGAQESEVWLRDVSAGTGWQIVATHVTDTAYTVSGLIAGHQVQFQTKPYKGFWIAAPDAWSDIEEVVVLDEPIEDPVTRVMLLGDSNTIGSTGDTTWRYRLWKSLAATAPGQVDLVGPRNDLFDRASKTYGHQQYVDPAFDRDHAAVWGMGVSFLATPVDQLVARHRVDTLVELLGMNDLEFLHLAPEEVAAEIRGLVADARSANPEVDVVLGEIAQTWLPGAPELNVLLHEAASDLDTPTARVLVADVADDFRRRRDTYDNSHANARGEVRIAAAVADALAVSGLGAPAARPLPDAAVGPRFPVVARAKVRHGNVKLRWTGSPGADGYRVLVRRPAASQVWRVAGDTLLRRLTVRSLRPGERYVFLVLPRKGRNVAAMDVRSNRISLRP